MSICFKSKELDYNTINVDGYTSEESFIANINQEVSVACSLPYTIHTKEVRRIITEAAKWFYKHSENAVEERYYVIPKNLFESDQFLCDRTIVLPSCVASVHSLNESVGGTGVINTQSFDGTDDTSVNKFFFRDVFFSNTGLSNSSEALMYYIISASFIDLVGHVTMSPISYTYNPNTHKLHVGGKTPKKDVVLSLYRKIELPFLMNDEIFFRYVSAKVKTQLARVLGTIGFNLPGGATLNFDMYKEEGQSELESIIEEIKGESGSDFFFMTQST